jgi:hypothetical protein
MHKNATKYNETLNKWCKNKHGASKIMDMLETYQRVVDVGKCSSIPGNGARKLADGAVMMV